MFPRQCIRTRALARYASSAATSSDPTTIRNIALVAHIGPLVSFFQSFECLRRVTDSGKTTLTESILHTSAYLSCPGSVDTGSTTTDFLPAERERGITIQSASIPVKWKDWTFNLIDTPGHADFGMEVESASRVIDGAVVLIDSVEGVEAQTKGVWRQLDRYDVATKMVFMNKLDRPGSSFPFSVRSLLSHRMHRNPMAITLPISSVDPQDYANAEPGVRGVIDLVKWESWLWNKEGEYKREALPTTPDDMGSISFLPPKHPLLSHLVPARTALLENLSMFSEELMNQLLETPESNPLYLKTPEVLRHLRSASLKNEILPVLCGAAAKHIGTDLVLDYVGELLASPIDVLEDKRMAAKEPLRALVWKVTWDKKRGWMSFVRVYSGRSARRITTGTSFTLL